MTHALDDVEDVYPLSPLQERMLFQSLAHPEKGLFILQTVADLANVDVEAFRKAWQRLAERHATFRTTFHWEDINKPVQVVHRHAEVQITILDWRTLDSAEQATQFRALLREDRRRGFDLNRLPLQRLTLIQLSPSSTRLLWSHHHILIDGWSGPILFRELFAFYDAYRKGEELDLPRPRPFRDYVDWLQRQDFSEVERYWRKELQGFSAPTPLPGERYSGRSLGNTFDSRILELPEELAIALNTLARDNQLTLSTIFQAAWAILLARHAQVNDVVFGSVVSGRPPLLEGCEHMVGLFINTLAVRVRLSPPDDLISWLKDLQQQQFERANYEHSPLFQVQRWSELPAGVPLYESLLIYENYPRDLPQLKTQGRNPRRKALTEERTDVPLLISITPEANTFLVQLTYDEARFDATLMPRLLDQLRLVLEQMAFRQNLRVRELTILSETERERILIEWNNTARDYPRDLCLHQLFERQAESTPDATALIFEGRKLTYRDLNEQSNQLAHYLRSIGVARGALVGISVERSPEMAVALLAVLKAGAAYVPLDPHYPAARLRFMLQDSQATVILTQQQFLDRLPSVPESAPQIICLDRDGSRWKPLPVFNPPCRTCPSDLAYVLYTSGSTGQPKGVAIPHRVSVNRMFIEHDPFEPGEVLPVKTSLNFVDSLWELFSAWRNGLTAVLVPESKTSDPRELVSLLSECGATRIVLVPSLLRTLLHSGIDLQERLPRLRHWISSGEPLPPDLCREFAAQLPRQVLVNLYGTSEIWDATRCDSRERPPGEPLPIGRPMGNMRVYVLDERLQPVPVGVAGELYVAGAGLATGYWRRPELTASKFLPDPFALEPGSRMYRTGDRVRWLADGNLEFLGRVDYLVKIRGFRIELGEVETILTSHPSVRQAIVTVTADEQLAAYILPVPGTNASIPTLRDYARTQLPEYMVPAFFVLLDRVPLTPTGKVDRKALPPVQVERQTQAEGCYVEPRSETEKTIALVFAEVLRQERIGLNDHFFHLGGHSLLATRAVLRLSKLLGVTVPVRALFETPTVGALAATIESLRAHSATNPEGPQLQARSEPRKEFPLSFAQQRLWFLDQLEPGSISYTLPNPVRLHGPLNVAALEAALSEIIRRHESLRTTFSSQGGQPFQVIHPPEPVRLFLVSLAGLPLSQQEAECRRHVREMTRQPWDLARGPLVRLLLLRLSADEHLLVITMHHIITDGWSMGLFASELATLYKAFSEGHPSPLPPPPLQYADYAVWQRKYLQGDVLNQHLNYWRKKLSGVSDLDLPTDHPRPAIHRYRGARHEFTVPATTLDRVRRLTQEENATLFMTALAVFQVLLSRYSGQQDICVGTPIANRNRVELERVIGFFANTLVLRTQLSGSQTFRELLQSVRQTCLEAYEHQDLPFERLVDELKPERNLSRQPLFQVMLILQTPVRSAVNAGNLTFGVQNRERETANFDLLLLLVEEEHGLSGTLIYNADLFEPTTAERMSKHFARLTERLTSHPDQPIKTIPILEDAERQQILFEWNKVPTPSLSAKFVHQLVDEQARLYPDHLAVHAPERMVYYGELVREANRLAHRLIARGVQPETVVGMCLKRSPEAIVTLLGILKAGGVYLPLDPNSPRERFAHQLNDAKPALVVGHGPIPEVVAAAGISWWDWQKEKESIAQQPDVPPDTPLRPENLAYIIYTSGSTGLPKGVMIEHRSLTNLIQAQIPLFALGPESRVLQMISLTFDASLGEIFRALASGATLYQPPEAASLPGPEMLHYLRSHRITAMALPPSVLSAIPEGEELPDLRTLTVGGEACPAELARRWAPGRRLLNGYGPTETTIGATLACNWDPERKPPLGRPLANVQLYVLDRSLQPVPIGVPGELYIGGAGVARGYLNNPFLTAERFLPDPFGAQPGSRLYRTGDLVRWLPSGELDFLGRIDQQVKIRGFRIELGEIESALARHDHVQACVVDVRPDHLQRPQLVGYVVPRGQPVPPTSELRSFLKQYLPDYMIPAMIVPIAALPITANGKVDRKALPNPQISRSRADHYEAPHPGPEAVLAGIWSQVLGVERVGRHDNFFELGGDSIISIRVIARAAEAGLRISPKDLFQHQTIAELASIAGTRTAAIAEQGIITGELPLTPIQHWFFEADPPEPHHFNHVANLPLPRDTNWQALEEAFRKVVEHHDALRSRFQLTPDGWRAFISEPNDDPVSLDHVDLSGVPEVELSARIEEAILRIHKSLDLTNGPLLRLVRVNLGQQGSRVLLIVHHLVVDAVSWRILLEDLMKIYRQIRVHGRDGTIRLPPKTTSYRQWAYALQNLASSESLQEELKFWLDPQRQSVQRLPRDFDGENTKLSSDKVQMTLNADETHALLQEVTQAFKVHVHEVLLTALAKALSEWMGESRLLINVEGHGREDIGQDLDLSRTVGWFTSFYPLLVDLSGTVSLSEALRAVQSQIRRVPSRGVGYMVLRYLSPSAAIREQFKALPAAEVAFNYLSQQGRGARTRVTGSVEESPSGDEELASSQLGLRRHLFEVSCIVRQGLFSIRWAFSKNLHRQETVRRLVERYAQILRNLVDESRQMPDQPPQASDFPMANLTQEELDRLLAQINKTQSPPGGGL